MLMIPTSKGMLYWIFGHTTNLGPAVPLDSILVVGPSGLEQRFVSTSSPGHDTNLRADIGGDGLLPPRGQSKPRRTLLVIVGDDHGEAAGSSRKGPSITHLGFDIADNGPLGNLLQRQDIANSQCGLLSTVDELSGVHALGGHHEFGITLEAIGIEELDFGHRRAPTGIVEDFFHDSTDVATTFGVVNGS